MEVEKVYVIFATYNGEGVLDAVLKGYMEALKPNCEWHLFIVDNGSTDKTSALIDKYSNCLPITKLYQPVPGKNKCLNYAISKVDTQRSAVIFTDDDAVPSPDFLTNWVGGINDTVAADLFGGTIHPLFPIPEPSWLKCYSNHYPEIFAINSGPSGKIEPQAIFGPNMAVRGSVFHGGIKFNEEIGPNSVQNSYSMGSETEFCVRAARELGLTAWFVSEPSVQHIVRQSQMTRSFVSGRAFRHGRGFAFQHHSEDVLSSLPRFNWKQRVRKSFHVVLSKLGSASSNWELHWRAGYWDWINDRSERLTRNEVG